VKLKLLNNQTILNTCGYAIIKSTEDIKNTGLIKRIKSLKDIHMIIEKCC